MLESIMVVLYIIVCGLWGMFATNMQQTQYPERSGVLRVQGCFLINAVFCPIAIMVALVRFETYMTAIRNKI